MNPHIEYVFIQMYCTKSHGLGIIRLHTVHLKGKIFHFLDIYQIIKLFLVSTKNVWNFSKKCLESQDPAF